MTLLDNDERPSRIHKKTLYHGIGRTVSTESLELRAIRNVLAKNVYDWKPTLDTALTAFILSRSESAVEKLANNDLNILKKRIIIELNAGLNSHRFTVHYSPYLLAGILRRRAVDRNFLTNDTDPEARKISSLLDERLPRLQQAGRYTPKLDKLHTILSDLREYLDGKGQNRDILLDIDLIADGGD
jgi:hypothetical protein